MKTFFGEVNERPGQPDEIKYANPCLALIDDLLGKIGPERQRTVLLNVLMRKETWQSDKEAVPLVVALKRLLELDLVGYRVHLMEIYNGLPENLVYELPGFFSREQIGGLNFRLHLLAEILEGWVKDEEDAEPCFVFFCKVYTSTVHYGQFEEEFRKKLQGLLRNTLKDKGYSTDLDKWILLPKLPEKFAEILLHARLKHYKGIERGVREVEFLRLFGLHERSESAVGLAEVALERFAIVDDLAQQVVRKVGVGCLSREVDALLASCEGGGSHTLLNSNTAVVIVTIRKLFESDGPGITKFVQKIRDQVLVGVKNPPKIYIEIEGPNNYHFSERE